MECNKKPIKFNVQQIEKCKKCKFASGNVNHETRRGWCSKYKVFINDKNKIIHLKDPVLEVKKLTLPSKRQMAKNFMGSAMLHLKSGLKQRSEADQLKCRLICESCGFMINNRCLKCGCYLSKAIKWATKHCPVNKW